MTYQELPALEDDQNDDDLLDSADDLKLDTEFKTGVYLSIGVKVN